MPPDFEHFTVRYRFSNNLEGGSGEVPFVELDSLPLPPLRQSKLIKVHFLSDKLAKSNLMVWWETNSGVQLRWYGPADDTRLKAQYGEDNDLAEKIINLLAKQSEGREKHNLVLQLGQLSLEGIPAELRQFVAQIETWKTFIKEHGSIFNFYPSRMTGDEYLVLGITGDSVKFRETVERSPLDGNAYDDCYVMGKKFDPGAALPVVTENEIYWELAGKKIVVAVPHNAFNVRLAEHYGYSKTLQEFIERKKAGRRNLDEMMKQRFKEVADKRQIARANLTKELLS